ncbi:GIY-YIG nuclease family protein [Komagataeibacter melaceti]|uniref:GIY-YIG nuclease family protein n=1 Tax=Komagataeibacter melaceti TaxID=2766577 RepID=UPI0011E5D21E|nr:GIY-YIG nuclease family protein [Komagataeibacter melaceti]
MCDENADALIEIGFRDVGKWELTSSDRKLDYILDGFHAKENGILLESKNSLYAFVHNEYILYIGKTAGTIQKRFRGYKNPHQRQRTNWRCNEKIRDLLNQGQDVRIYVFATTSSHLMHLCYSTFSINIAAGLEDALIEKFNPPWNGRDKQGTITETEEREIEELGEEDIDVSSPVDKLPSQGTARFEIKLGDTYYKKGWINPGVEASRELGDHDEHIRIYLGNRDSKPVISLIDRKANSSGAVRIRVNCKPIAKWFQNHFKMEDCVQAIVLDRNDILLTHY